MNTLLNILNRQNPIMNNISGMINSLRAASNPQAAVQQMAASNPQMQQVMQYIQSNGGDAKAAFYNLAQQKGVNPDDILNQLNGLMR